jgi:ribosomal protein L37AE/L43A
MMTEIIGRVVDGVAMAEPDLIEWKECPVCAEPIRRRTHFCKHCKTDYRKDAYRIEQEAFAQLEEKMKREKAEAKSG